MSKSTKTILLTAIIFIIAAGAITYGAFWYQRKTENTKNQSNTNQTANTNTNQDSGYVALGDINMDQSKWVTYRNEELGISLLIPSKLYYKGAKLPFTDIYNAMISNSEHVIAFFIDGQTNNRPPKENFFIELSKSDKGDYTESQFMRLGEVQYNGEYLPLVANGYDYIKNKPHYRELRIWTLEQQQQNFNLENININEDITRTVLDHKFLINGYIYYIHSQIDTNNFEPFIKMIDEIAGSIKIF